MDPGASLDQTLAALDGGVTALSPAAATSAIDTWIDALDGREALGGIRRDLVDLKAALAAEALDGPRIGDLLVRLGAQTRTAAATADPRASAPLARLGGLLENAGNRLSTSR